MVKGTLIYIIKQDRPEIFVVRNVVILPKSTGIRDAFDPTSHMKYVLYYANQDVC